MKMGTAESARVPWCCVPHVGNKEREKRGGKDRGIDHKIHNIKDGGGEENLTEVFEIQEAKADSSFDRGKGQVRQGRGKQSSLTPSRIAAGRLLLYASKGPIGLTQTKYS